MWQEYKDIDFALEGAPADVLDSLPVACRHLTPMPDAVAPDGLKFSIDAIRTKAIDAPIPLFGDDDMTAGSFYNVLYELAFEDGFCNMDKVREKVNTIAEFVAAIMYDRWAISSDLDLERELVNKIEDVYRTNDLANGEMFTHPEPECDYNEAHYIFDSSDLLSEWVAEMACRALNTMFRRQSLIGSDEDEICYFSGALYKGSLPCFKSSGFSKMKENISWSMMELLYAIKENETVVTVYDIEEVMNVCQGEGLTFFSPQIVNLVSESVVDGWRKTGRVDTYVQLEEDSGEDWGWDGDNADGSDIHLSFDMNNACVVLFDSTCDEFSEQVGFIAALGLLGELPDEYEHVLAVQMSKDARSIRLVKAMLESYGLKVVTAIGLGVEWCADVYDMLSPGIFVPVPTLRSDDYRYTGKWSDDVNEKVVDAYAAMQSMGLAYSIVTAANEARGFSVLASEIGAEVPLDVTPFLNPEENIPPEWTRLMISEATGGLIELPEYDAESVRANFSYGMMYLKKLYQMEHAELVKDAQFMRIANMEEYHDPSLDKLYAVSGIYNKYNVFVDNYRTIGASDNVQPMTRELAIQAGKVVWQMAQGTDADLAIHAIADGVPMSDVLA